MQNIVTCNKNGTDREKDGDKGGGDECKVGQYDRTTLLNTKRNAFGRDRVRVGGRRSQQRMCIGGCRSAQRKSATGGRRQQEGE